MSALYELQQVHCDIGGKRLLENLSFEIREGEWLAVLGPNGSGKTSLLKLLSGLWKPSGGELRFRGKNLAAYARREVARQIAVLPQENSFEFPFTAREVVLMGRFPHLKGMAWESADDLAAMRRAMEETGCWNFADRDVRSLSGGERERVLLARSLAQDTDVLLFDEPTTHLDLEHQRDILELGHRLNREQGKTLVWVLHDLNFALRHCHRILLLKNGRLEAIGTPDQVLSREKIQTIYGVSMSLVPHPISGRPCWLPDF